MLGRSELYLSQMTLTHWAVKKHSNHEVICTTGPDDDPEGARRAQEYAEMLNEGQAKPRAWSTKIEPNRSYNAGNGVYLKHGLPWEQGGDGITH